MSPRIAHTAARIEQQLVDLATGQPKAVVDFINEVRKAAAEAPDAHSALWDVLDIMREENHRRAIAQSAHLPGCVGHLPDDNQVCSGPTAALSAPSGLDVREGQFLEARLVRVRDSEQPQDEVFIQSGGNGTGLTPEAADQLADQLVGFAAQVRRMARQIGNATEAAKATR